MFKSSLKLANGSSRPRHVFPAPSRKGRARHSSASRPHDSVASGGDTLAGSSKSKTLLSVGESIKKPEVRSFLIICVTACVSLLMLQFVGSEETFAQFFPPSRLVP